MMVVFIAGASASGKTTLAMQLLMECGERGINCSTIKLDDYYKEIPDGRDLEHYKQTTNFDDPCCLDFPLLKDHIMALERGESIAKPVFDFKIEHRVGVELMVPPSILLVDGTASLFFVSHFMPDLEMMFKVFIEVEPETLLQRRMARDLVERGYGNEESILKKDAEYVRPTFLALIEPTKFSADKIINNDIHYGDRSTSPLFLAEVGTMVDELQDRMRVCCIESRVHTPRQ